MAILILLLVSLLSTACYSPDLRDCTVTCTGASECAASQVCTAEHFCAAPDVSCAMPPDAPLVPRDAPAGEDAPPIDALATGDLHVRIMDKGNIEVTGVGTCPEDCTYTVLLDMTLELRAIPGKDREFERWTSAACSGADETCILTPVDPVTEVSVKFRKD